MIIAMTMGQPPSRVGYVPREPVYSLQMAQRYDGGGRAMRRQVEAGSSNPGGHIEQVRVD